MMAAPQAAFLPRGELRLNEPMSRHTSWRVGGPAEQYFVPADRDDLILFLQRLPRSMPVTWVGLGSNLLVRDGGVRGVVIATQKCLQQLRLVGDQQVYVEAGVPGAKIARFCARHDLIKAEFFAGIPGTFGGALAMNAGAFGSETWDVIVSVQTVDHGGVVTTRQPKDFKIGYRSVTATGSAQKEWFISGVIRLDVGDGEKSQARIREFLSLRSQTQPIQLASAGSVFRNPEGDHAARLIESTGLKGLTLGGACVSSRHANFIINTGGATAAEIEDLIHRVQKEVADTQGILLQREVHIVGEPL